MVTVSVRGDLLRRGTRQHGVLRRDKRVTVITSKRRDQTVAYACSSARALLSALFAIGGALHAINRLGSFSVAGETS